MKEIWINLELYFESYEFYNFQGFFRIFLVLFSIENHFEKKKKKKKGFRFCEGPTWMRRGTPGHVAAPRGPTRRLRGIYIYV